MRAAYMKKLSRLDKTCHQGWMNIIQGLYESSPHQIRPIPGSLNRKTLIRIQYYMIPSCP